MSFSQVTETSPETFATEGYFQSISPLNKTSKFFYNVDTTRVYVLEGTPAPGDVITYNATNSGTWADPDTASWSAIPAPSDPLESVPTRNWGAGTGRNVGTADNVVIGDTASSAGQSQTLTLGSSAICNGSSAVAAGYDSTATTQGVAVGALAICNSRGVVVGYNSKMSAGSTDTVIVGPNNGGIALTGANNVILGNTISGITSGAGNILCGASVTVPVGTASNAIGIGTSAATNSSSVVIGANASAAPQNAAIVGTSSTISVAGTNSCIFGPNNASTAGDNLIVGYNNTNAAANSLCMGKQNSLAAGATNSVVIGRQAAASADQNTVVGYLAGAAYVAGASCTLLGTGANANTAATNVISIGASAFGGGNNAVAIGGGSSTGVDGISINAFTTSDRNTLVGNLTLSQANNCTMVGYGQQNGAGATGSIFYGYNNGRNVLTGINNVILGRESFNTTVTTAANNVIVGSSHTAASASVSNGIAIGTSNTVTDVAIAIGATIAASGNSCIVLGASASCSAAGTNSIVMGTQAASTAASGVCIGHLAKQANTQGTVVGYNAGNASGTASNTCVFGQNAGTTTNGGQCTIIGSSANSSNLRTDVTAVGASANSSQSFCTVVGSQSSSTAANANAFGYDVDNTTSDTTRIGNNKSTAHIVDSEGLFRSVNQVHCVASGTAQVIGAGPTTATLGTEDSSYPAGLLDNPNDWIYLSAVGTESAGRTYSLSMTLTATASATNNRWIATMWLNEPGIGGTPRQVGWSQLCASIATACATDIHTEVKINAAITGRPYFYVSLTRVTGAGTVTIDNIRESFSRIA